ncbi:AaceriAFR683Cp [[Ashbya] aceris (nom. inval.)]|nr:AaceriAFR683Cp [[Ashbya] aceris (nom. inval.)]
MSSRGTYMLISLVSRRMPRPGIGIQRWPPFCHAHQRTRFSFSASTRVQTRLQSTATPRARAEEKPYHETLELSAATSKASGAKDVRRLFQLARPELKSLLCALVLIVISGAVSMTIPSVIGKLLDVAREDAKQESGDEEEAVLYGLPEKQFYLALSGVFAVGALANMGRIVILKTTGERLVARLRTRTMKAALEQEAAFLDSNRVGDLISRLSSDASIVSKSITQNTSDGARAVIQGAVGFGMMSYISWQLTAVMMLLAPPLVLMAAFYGRRVRNLSRELQTKVGGLTKVAEEQLNATRTVQAYCGERREIRRYATEVRNVFGVGLKEALTSGSFFGATGFVGNATLLALLLTGTSMIKSGGISVGELSSFMMYAVYTGSSLFNLSSFYSELMKGAGAAVRVFELNDRTPIIHPTIGKDPVSLAGKTVSFNSVNFAYPTRPHHQVFAGMDLSVSPGEHVCIVGPSGGGKSTVASLLLRFYDPISGSVTVGGQDIRSFNLRKYRRMLGIVQQEPVLFNASILENITYALPPHLANDSTRVDRALRLANCSAFIASFPDGLQTPVGPRGTQLSGGQKQRVALARAFLQDPAILILDEATSALDSKSEAIVASTLLQRCQDGKITISIAHRKSTIQHSTRVIVLDKLGHVLETGTYEQLISDPSSSLRRLLSKEHSSDAE